MKYLNGLVFFLIFFCFSGSQSPCLGESASVRNLKFEAYQYYTGDGKKNNFSKALALYKKAANLGDAEAQYIVGGMFYKGLGTEINAKEAFKWFLKAAGHGKNTPESLAIIGLMYLKGEGVPQNYVEARKWYVKAVAGGSAKAQSELAYMYYNGLGGEQNFVTALELYSKAAFAGDIQAQYNVGMMYATGTGVELDLVKGYAWYSLASSQGNTTAMVGRNSLLAQMNLDELNQAQALAVDLYNQVEGNK